MGPTFRQSPDIKVRIERREGGSRDVQVPGPANQRFGMSMTGRRESTRPIQSVEQANIKTPKHQSPFVPSCLRAFPARCKGLAGSSPLPGQGTAYGYVRLSVGSVPLN